MVVRHLSFAPLPEPPPKPGRFTRARPPEPRRERGRLRLVVGMLVLALLASVAVAREAQAAPAARVIVRFAPDADRSDRADAREAAGADFGARLPLPGLQVVEPEPGRSAAAVADRLERSEDVVYAEPDVSRRAFVVPNDAFTNLLWGLDNTGQTIDNVEGTVDADIDAAEAWDVTTGDPSVTVGILDTGVDNSHSDLAPNIWANPGETGAGRETNGIDDDANGYVDDYRGWDWVADDNNPDDEHWHGTHVAGTVGARGNDGVGVAGVAWHVGLVPLRVLSATGSGQVSDLISAYAYADQQGLKIVNASLGGSQGSQAEYDALQAASDTLFVVAAGNGGGDGVGDDNDVTETFPCAYDLPNVICVAATNNRDELAGFSNFGSTSVDLAAPGVKIASTMTSSSPGDHWAYADGTSMATPHVSGAAALEWARFPTATVTAIRSLLLSSVDPVPSLAGKTVTGGRLNVFRALGGDPPGPPGTSTIVPPLPGGTTPTAPAPTPAGGAALDTRPPGVVVVPRGRLKLRPGVRVRTRCSEACSLRQDLVLGVRTARRVGIHWTSARVVGRVRGRLGRAGAITVRLKLKASARRRLKRAHTLRLELRTRAVDRAGNVTVIRRSIQLYAH